MQRAEAVIDAVSTADVFAWVRFIRLVKAAKPCKGKRPIYVLHGCVRRADNAWHA